MNDQAKKEQMKKRKERQRRRRWHKRQIKQYAERRSLYLQYKDVLFKALQNAASEIAPLAIVQSRAKKVDSFAEKALRTLLVMKARVIGCGHRSSWERNK